MESRNLASTNVTVFPAARRDPEYDTSSRIFTEKNIVSLTNRMSPIKSFIVSDEQAMRSEQPFVFVLGGYYFSVPNVTEILKLFEGVSNIAEIYAYITLDSGMQNPEIAGQDYNGYYLGLTFTDYYNSSWESNPIEYIKILEKDPAAALTVNNITLPQESRYVFTDANMKIDIDGGIIPLQTQG